MTDVFKRSHKDVNFGNDQAYSNLVIKSNAIDDETQIAPDSECPFPLEEAQTQEKLNSENLKEHLNSEIQQASPNSRQRHSSETFALLAQRRLSGTPNRCLGPVDDLEAHVKPAWWKEIFRDEFYLKTDGDVVEDPDVTRKEVDLLEDLPFVKSLLKEPKVTRILDLCCGQGRHSIEIASRYPNVHMYGHDQSDYLVCLARRRATSRGISTQCVFSVGDSRSVPYPDAYFDLVLIMGNSFGYFESADANLSILQECFRLCRQGAHVVLDLADSERARSTIVARSWEWIGESSFVCRERQLSKDNSTLFSREVITDTSFGVIRDQFYSERLYDRSEINALLDRAGFLPLPPGSSGDDSPKKDEISFIVIAAELSKRREDLGLMARRLMVTACKQTSVEAIDSMQNGNLKKNCYQKNAPGILFNNEAKSLNTGNRVSNQGLQQQQAFESNRNGENPLNQIRTTKIDSTTVVRENKLPKSVDLGYFPDIAALILIMGDPSKPCLGKLGNTWNTEDLETQGRLIKVLKACWTQMDVSVPEKNFDQTTSEPPERRLYVLNNHDSLIDTLTRIKVKENGNNVFVLNLCDEGYQNDAFKELHVPALLEILGFPYSGAESNCLAFCYDKGIVNSTVRGMGFGSAQKESDKEKHASMKYDIPTPREACFLSSITVEDGPAMHSESYFDALLQSHGVKYPAFVKPVRGDNSLGITPRSLVLSGAALKNRVMELESSDIGGDVVIQQYLGGTEYSIGLIGNPTTGYTFLPPLEVDYRALDPTLVPILGFESKWDPDSAYWKDINHIPARLPKDVELELFLRCTVLFERFGCRDYARFDFRSDEVKPVSPSTVRLLEVNPNPGWCWDGKLAKMAGMAGLSYSDLIALILRTSWGRHKGNYENSSKKIFYLEAKSKQQEQ